MSSRSDVRGASEAVLTERLREAMPERRVQLGRAVAGEWVKARSMPSTWSSLVIFGIIMVVLSILIPSIQDLDQLAAPQQESIEPVALALSGVFLGQLAVALLGALLVTAEYSSRSILGSTLWVPRRPILLTGKLVVLVALVTPAALVVTLLSGVIGLTILQDKGLSIDMSDPEVWWALLGGAAYLTLIAVLGLATGTLLRSSAAAVVALTFLLFLLPVLVGLLPADTADAILPWLPSQAGQAALQLNEPPGYLPSAGGLALLIGYATVGMVSAVARFTARDI